MEKELIINGINGIKYVRYEELKPYKIYDLIKDGLIEKIEEN